MDTSISSNPNSDSDVGDVTLQAIAAPGSPGPPDDPGDDDDDDSESSSSNDSSSEDSTSSEAEEQQPNVPNTIRDELLAGIRLTPYRFLEGRPGPNYNRLTPSIRCRCQYAMLQRRWRRDRGKVIRDVLDGKDPLAFMTFPPGTDQYWVDLFSRESPPVPDIDYDGTVDLLGPISPEEILWLKKTVDQSSAPSPDGLTIAQFLALPNDRMQTAYTLVLQSGESSEVWQSARTTLIPKATNPENPADFRPITMTSWRARCHGKSALISGNGGSRQMMEQQQPLHSATHHRQH